MSTINHDRFKTAYEELQDCWDHIEDNRSEEEEADFKKLVQLCYEIVTDYDYMLFHFKV